MSTERQLQVDSILADAKREAEEIRREAKRDADQQRRNATAAARRLVERLHALEWPLGELVADIRSELERVEGELENGGAVDSHATAIPAASESRRSVTADKQVPSVAEPARESATPGPTTESPVRKPAPPPSPKRAPAGTPPWFSPAAEPEEKKWGSMLQRLKAWRGAPRDTFITSPGHCAVCQRSFIAGSVEDLKASGWQTTDDVGLCPDCQQDDWQLPEGARLPFRRGGT